MKSEFHDHLACRGRRPRRAGPGAWPWKQCKEDRERRQRGYIGSQPKGKTEAPICMKLPVERRAIDGSSNSKGTKTMNIIAPDAIPQWLRDEVEEYFVPLPFEPKSILDIGANIGAFTQRAHKEWPQAHIICC